jgi:C4-dicarboxylate transporter, DctM subunit
VSETPWYRRGLPRGARLGAAVISVALLLVACGDAGAPLEPIGSTSEGGPVIERLEPATGSPAGGERVTIIGKNLGAANRVWVGEALVYEVEASPDGTRLTFKTPTTRVGAALDVGVGKTDDWGEVVEQRVVARGAFHTTGPPRGVVVALGVAIALLALLGTPLFIVITAVTCLGWYLQSQVTADVGFFTREALSGAQRDELTALLAKASLTAAETKKLGDLQAAQPGGGLGVDIFIAWLKAMGDSPLFIAIPLFTFAGALMSESKTPTRLISLCRALLGWMPGGISLVTIVACAFFTAFTGASGVTIIALGGLLFPILLREKYPDRFAIGLCTTCGSLGLLFPPSLPVIVYGLVARVDVGRLFQAAFIPGLVLCGFLFATSIIQALRSGTPRHAFEAGALVRGLRGAMWELPLPVLVIGGIYGGYVTAAEASAVTAFYVMVITLVVHRDIKLSGLPPIIRKTAVLVGAILMIIGTALGFTNWLTIEQVPQQILALMQSKISDQLTFLLMMNVFLLVVGCLMDIFSATLVVVPLIVPVALEFGVDPYHLAVIFLVNLEIGYSTPPVGINLFLAALRFRRSVLELYRASVLFILVLLAALALITYVPVLTLGVFDSLPKIAVPDVPASARQGEPREVKAVVRLGEVDVEEAQRRLAAARDALKAAEQRTGLVWADLDRAARDAEGRLRSAPNPDARRAAGEELRVAQEKQAPLRDAAKAVSEAERLVQSLGTLARTVRWRSRTTGQEATGASFDLSRLDPGDHLVSATARDERGHVAQTMLNVHIDAAPTPPPGEGGGGGGGDDGGWGWDGGTSTETTTER